MGTSERDEDIPTKFYKYRSMADPGVIKWVERIVCHNELYFAAAKTFNDPFDLRPVFSLEAPKATQVKEYERLSKKYEPSLNREQRRAQAKQVVKDSLSRENIKATEEAIQTEHARVITEDVGVYCVSAKRDDILMWSHYADYHKGICLEFDGEAKLMGHAQRVQYSHKRVPIKAYSDPQDESMTKALLTKSLQWSYEEEWRLINYNKGPGSVQFRPENLTGIVLGALASAGTVALIKQWAKVRLHPLDIYQASLSKTDYALDIKKRKI
ncbi:MAG: DUF2971 domain-containing protein [Burkholderiaceae bacterium]|nr:DUF2971 domain-containing protein [Burkholderiaceae bacterium]